MSEFLRNIMQRYTLEKMPEELSVIINSVGEEYSNDEKDIQRTQSLKFVWGHNHDFGSFKMAGQMGDRHIEIIDKFISLGMPKDLSGMVVLDIGVWCGGTSLLLAGMGATVIAVEEVPMYANCADFLFQTFDLDATAVPMSLYDYYHPQNKFDMIVFPGVLYHLSDPLLALRMLFNMLCDNGYLYIETMTTDISPGHPALEYRGSQKAGWNWFAPNKEALNAMLVDVGFETEECHIKNNRLITMALRKKWKPMVKAGLARKIR